MIKNIVLLVAVIAVPLTAEAQTPCTSIAGTWRMTEFVDAKGATMSPGENLWLYTVTHYSITWLRFTNTRQPLPAEKTPGNPTDAEKLVAYDHWALVTAQAGTYSLERRDITMKVVVAKNQAAIGREITHQCTMEGSTMVHLAKNGARSRFVRVAQ